MAVLDRRVQILLDPDQYSALESEARATHRSVASLIREAIDNRVHSDVANRQDALRRLLSGSGNTDDPAFDLAEFKSALETDVERRFDGPGT